LGKVGVLKITNPVGHTKMAEVDNGCDVQLFEFVKRIIGKHPIVLTRTGMCFIIGWAIPQEGNSQASYQFKIKLPVGIVTALLHFINPFPGTIRQFDSGITVFNACGKHELVPDLSHNRLLL
jgi:hypothetical protein